MKVGAVFPQTEIGSDPIAVRDWTQAAEDLGFDHLIVYDHVLGADGSHHTNLTGPYRLDDMFHEPFVLFGYMAALTQRIELVTAVIIIGQRQTALAAKQAAEVDVLSGGRLRLGLGTGWNHVEYEALSENFNNRGRRSEEQIELMRELWAKDVLDFDGKWHKVTKAGINPRPVQQTIPIWLGGGREAAPGNRGERVLERVGRMADGFFPMWPPDRAADGLERVRNYAREAGRDPASIGIEGRVNHADGLEQCVSLSQAWKDLDASHVSINTMNAGLKTVQDHINAVRDYKDAVKGIV